MAEGRRGYVSSGENTPASERYSKHELMGQGACKRVYRGFDEVLGIEVAWNEVPIAQDGKCDAQQKERIFKEINLLSQLKHKNILALQDWWLDKETSTLIFITELCMDGTLRQYRSRHKHVSMSVIKNWAWQILQGLVYLHGHTPPIIHRDLKSDNIFVNGSSGSLKIGDLGFATGWSGLNCHMSVIGTPEFMAPELYEEQYNEKVDVYSFGLVLLELATMEYPYSECRNAGQIFKKVCSGVPPQGVDKISDAELREFVKLCITHDPAQRPEARQLLKHPFFECIHSISSNNNLHGMASKPSSPRAASLPQPFSALPNSGTSAPPSRAGSGLGAAPGGCSDAGAGGTVVRTATGLQPSSRAGSAAPAGSTSASREGSTGGAQLPPMQRKTWPPVADSSATGLLSGRDGGGNGGAGYPGGQGHADGAILQGAATVGSMASTGECGVLTNSSTSGGSSRAASYCHSQGGEEGSSTSGKPSPESGQPVWAVSSKTVPSGSHHDHHHDHHPLPKPGPSPFANIRSRTSRISRDFSEEEAYEGPGVGLPTAGSSTGPAARASSGSVTGTSQSQPLVQVQEEEVVEHAGQAGAPKQDIRLACLSTADRVLAFSMSFMRDGSRRKVGFQYDLDADTVEEVAQEMVDSLSINWEDARFVAGLIQDEIQKLEQSRYSSSCDAAGVSHTVVPQVQQQEQQRQQQELQQPDVPGISSTQEVHCSSCVQPQAGVQPNQVARQACAVNT